MDVFGFSWNAQTVQPYLSFIAAEHVWEGVEPGVQVSSGGSWVEQCFHYKGMEEGFSGYHFNVLHLQILCKGNPQLKPFPH